MNRQNQIIARSANWLPLPCADLRPKENIQNVDENDFFAKGDVLSFFSHQGTGVIKNVRGEEIPFSLSQINFIGPKSGREFLSAGIKVGYDVSWTSSGLRINKLKVY